MKNLNLNSNWEIRWCTGQRGGMPHYIQTPDEPIAADILNLPKEITDDYDPRKWIPATVPGVVHSDLISAGIIESPYTGTGILSCRWVEECFWFYRTVFDAEEAAKSLQARLIFSGLDYSAVVYLNSKEIIRHENSFYPCGVDVTGILKEKGNVMVVRLESGLFSVCEKPARNYFTGTMSVDTLLHKRIWMRKCQSQFEWDWAPRLLNIGITGGVDLFWSKDIIVSNSSVNATLSPDLKTGEIWARAFIDQKVDDVGNIKLKVSVDDKVYIFEYNNVPENKVIEGKIKVENPELWWPVGYGEQDLYNVKIQVIVRQREIYTKEKLIGFRHINVNQDPHEEKGNYFVFEINNKPIFLKGANLVPNEILATETSRTRYEILIDLALQANFNFLRIWGGGYYESDDFYEICDEKGILVWQEFIGACGVIPADDPELFASIEKEATYNIRRLSNHPSLIAWCGSNETGWMTKDFDGMHARDDFVLYFELYPSLLKKEAPGVFYHPTSPYTEFHDDYNDFYSGDQHPWGVGFEYKDSRDYEDYACRFPNEGGILGPVSLPTVKACLNEGEGIHSFSWQVHDNMLENYKPGSSPDQDLRFWTDLDIDDLQIDEYVFAGGLTQAEGLKRYIENFRRRKYDSSGAVFWMYNDCWPVVRSWTIVDYYLRRTPSFHPVRRAFSPLVAIMTKQKDNYHIYGVNDTLKNQHLTLRYGAFTTTGQYLMDKSMDVTLPANTSKEFALIPLSKIEKAGGATKVIGFVQLIDEKGNIVARSRYTNALMNELKLKSPNIEITATNDGYIFESSVYVMGICIDLDGEDNISDNFFDLYPNQPYFVKTEDTSIENPVLFTWNDFVVKDDLNYKKMLKERIKT